MHARTLTYAEGRADLPARPSAPFSVIALAGRAECVHDDENVRDGHESASIQVGHRVGRHKSVEDVDDVIDANEAVVCEISARS